MAAQHSAPSLVLGRILAPHGIRGWLKVQSFADPPEALLQHRAWQLRLPDGSERSERVREVQWDGLHLRVALEGIPDRTAAEGLGSAEIAVTRDELPAGEHYRSDLVGFEVRNLEGVSLGTLDHFIDTPANAVMVVRGDREYWVPVTAQHLRAVRPAQRLV